MVEILKPSEGDDSPLTAAAHPVTRVYCDDEGIVCYERANADPIRLNQVSPKRSRKTAGERLLGLLDMIPDEHAIERDFPISRTGMGLTYNQLKMQTVEAVLKSREIEGVRVEDLEAKRKKRRS